MFFCFCFGFLCCASVFVVVVLFWFSLLCFWFVLYWFVLNFCLLYSFVLFCEDLLFGVQAASAASAFNVSA